MPVYMHWDGEDRRLYVAEYVGLWTWAELTSAQQQANSDLDAVDHPVDIIHDWTQSQGFPRDAFGQGRRMLPRMHPRTRWHVHVGTNPLFQSLWRSFVTIYGAFFGVSRFHFAASMDEARELLARLRREIRTANDQETL